MSVSKYSIVGGVPAKILKERFSQKDLKKHKDLIKLSNVYKD